MDFVRLNISGSSFLLRTSIVLSNSNLSKRSLLRKFVNSSHEERLRLSDGYIEDTNEYFFARCASIFEAIMHFHVTGELHKPKEICWKMFSSEMAFWQMEPQIMAECCRDECFLAEEQSRKEGLEIEPIRMKLKQRMWHFCEGDGSWASTGLQMLSIAFIAVSIISLILGTMGVFRIPREGKSQQNASASLSKSETMPLPIFGEIEYVCIAFFTIEYLVRFVLAPKKLAYIKHPMSIVDLTAILPFYIELFIQIIGVDTGGALSATVVLRVLRVLRVARILRLGRHSSLTRKFGAAVKNAAKPLAACLIFLAIMIIFFSTFVYYMEEGDDQSPITSIPAAFWWSIVTMTTVGYGDIVPVTVLGKLVGSVAIIAGVLVLALPITIIVSNFGNNELMRGEL